MSEEMAETIESYGLVCGREGNPFYGWAWYYYYRLPVEALLRAGGTWAP